MIPETIQIRLKKIYEQTPLEEIAKEYQPHDLTEQNDWQYHTYAKIINETPSIKLAKKLREFNDNKTKKADFLKDFVKLTSKPDLEEYTIQQDSRPLIDDRTKPVIYDGKFAFCLLHKNEIAAYTSFIPANKKIIIVQLQGTKGTKTLEKIRWEKALIEYTIDWAKQQNIHEIEILSAQNNIWAKMTYDYLMMKNAYLPNTTFEKAAKLNKQQTEKLQEKIKQLEQKHIHLLPHHGYIRYDVTAKRNKFTKNQHGNYTKQI